MAEVQVARVIDTRLEALSNNNVCYVVEEGASVVNYTPLISSSHSDQNTSFNLNNLAEVTCRDSRMVMGLNVTITLSCTNSTGSAVNVIQADNFGFKQYPLNRTISSIQHQINQASYTLNTNDILDMIARVNLLPENANFYENTMPDFIDSYANAVGSSITPLASYSSNLFGDGVYKPRTLNYTVTGNSVSANSTSNVVINATLYEPLISPFNNISDKNDRGLYGITGELINVQYVVDIFNNMFSFVAPAGITYSVISNANNLPKLGNNATLYTIYLTPTEGLIKEIPKQSVYHYNDYSIFSNNIGAVNAGQSANNGNVSSQVVSFTNIPQKIIIAARLSNGNRTSATPDKYLTIQNLTCSFDNGQPQLSNATTRQLFDISKRNGLTMPAACFQQLVLNEAAVLNGANPIFGAGSCIIVDPALDLGIRAGDSAGSAGKFVFQVTNANLKNNTTTNFANCTLYVIGVTNAVLERNATQYRNYLLSIPPNAGENAKQLPPVSHQAYMDARHANLFLSGGGIGDWFKKAYNKARMAVQWGLKNKEKLKEAYDKGKEVYDVGQKLLQESQQVEGKGAHFGREVRPKKRMDLFFN
jgi:hypothetical protein